MEGIPALSPRKNRKAQKQNAVNAKKQEMKLEKEMQDSGSYCLEAQSSKPNIKCPSPACVTAVLSCQFLNCGGHEATVAEVAGAPD